MGNPSQRGMAVLMRHLRMTDRRRHQFHDHLLHDVPQPAVGGFCATERTPENRQNQERPKAMMERFFDQSNETRNAALHNKETHAMLHQEKHPLNVVQMTTSREIADELFRWSSMCQERAMPGTDGAKPLNNDESTKVAMMSERFLRLAVTLIGRLEQPQVRVPAVALIARLHGTTNHRPFEPTMAGDAVIALRERLHKDPMLHWRFSAWGHAVEKQEHTLLLEAFAWLAGAQTALNVLRHRSGMSTDSWNDEAIKTWTETAAILGQGHRYLSDDGWNDRYLETQWRSNLRNGVDTTVAALSVETSIKPQ